MAWMLPDAFNPRLSLRARFTLLIGGSGLALALITAAVVDGYQREELVSTQGQAMRREALLLARTVDAALAQRLQQLRDTGSHPTIASGLMDPGETRLLLEGLRNQQPAWAWVAIASPQGRVQVATNALLEGEDLSRQPWFEPALRQAWIGGRHEAGALASHLGWQGASLPSLIDLALPLLDLQGRQTGVLVGQLRWDWLDGLYQAMGTPDRQLPGTDSLVLDRQGRVLLGPAPWLDQRLSLDGLDALRQGQPPGVLRWPDGGQYVTAWGRDAAGVSVLVRQPVALAFESADALRRRLLWLGGVGTLAFMAISLWLAGRVARPIQGLSAAALRVVHDEPPRFDALSPGRRDEVAELARALELLHASLSQRLVEQQQATQRYESLFRDAPVAIFVMLDDQLVLANAACLALFGAGSLDELRGKGRRDLIHVDDLPLIDARRERLLHPDGPQAAPAQRLTHRIVRLDGRHAEVESTAMTLPLGDRRGLQVAMHDVTEQRRALTLLSEREAQLTQTSRLAHVGGWHLDLGTLRGSWTDEMAAIFEQAPDVEPTPALALSFFEGEHRQRLKAALQRLQAEGVGYDLELQAHTSSGRSLWVRAYAQAVLREGRIVALEGVTQDITDRRAAQEALHELNAQLEQRVAERTAELRAANAELDAFAYAVSHDLRAPLRAMSGFSLALVEDHGPALDAEARAYLDQIIEGSRRMGELIEGLLALSRTVRGAMREDEVDLSALATQALGELRRADPARQVEQEVEPGLRARGDRRMLAAALANLLGNAWKYTAACQPARIRVYQQMHAGELWTCITDNGVGFDMSHAGRLYKAFARLHRQDEFPGLGIGLATVQRIIHRHGGRIEAEARPGEGATFRFTLPARRATQSTESEA